MKLNIDLSKEYRIVLEGGDARRACQVGAWKALRETGVKSKLGELSDVWKREKA